jgi:hypothetical protein
MSDQNAVANRNPFAPQEVTRHVGADAAVSRSIQEVQAALVVAKKFPRDEFAAIESIKTACKRPGLAENAEYEYSRGGTKITGPTIDLLETIAKRWGNIDYGWEEVERRDGESKIRAFAWDQQTNCKAGVTFVVRHWRDTQSGGYALKDERDIYELIANQASRRVRACLERVVDSDVVDMAREECKKTLRGQNKEPLVDRVRKMVESFSNDFSVSPMMLEARLGNKLDACSENQLASLRRVYKSLRDGVGKREDFFKLGGDDTPPPPPPQPAASTPPASDEKAEADAGLAPEQPPQSAPEPSGNVGSRLGDFMQQAGIDWETFSAYGRKQGWKAPWDNVDGFESLGVAAMEATEGFWTVRERIKNQIAKARAEGRV